MNVLPGTGTPVAQETTVPRPAGEQAETHSDLSPHGVLGSLVVRTEHFLEEVLVLKMN